jgi:membrane protein DedA with SNARE-associated domain
MNVTSHADSFLIAVKRSSLSRFAGLVAGDMRRWSREIVIALAVVFPVVFMAASYLEDLIETGSKESAGDIGALIAGLPSHVISVASNAGYAGVFFLTLLDSAGFPFPSEIILPFAGYLVFRGALQYWPVVFCSTVAAVLGASADYYIGRKLGGPLVTGKVRLPYIPAEQLQRAQAWFDKHGPVTVALLRWVPAARVLISFPAGACKIKPITFEFYTLLGCLTWNIALVCLGSWLGSSWGRATSYFRDLSLLVFFAFIVFAFWILKKSESPFTR